MLVVVCEPCCRARAEYYCAEHANLRGLYYTFLEAFSAPELARQREGLELHWRTIAGTPHERREATAALAAGAGATSVIASASAKAAAAERTPGHAQGRGRLRACGRHTGRAATP